ncbi:MAG: hypothetical protein ACI8Q3_002303, partial [Marinomonas primoryensis]
FFLSDFFFPIFMISISEQKTATLGVAVQKTM